MEDKNQQMTLGKSILVPSVQELAKESLESVPERYIQPYQDTPIIAADDDIQIPIIDTGLLFNGDTLEMENLHSACQEWGFFQFMSLFYLGTGDFLID
ncbi:putative 2-oxoglutarate/Fe(II)-dependent dioxygenase [Bienertia sinuspersici]